MSMSASLELRVPFLDHELVEYALQLPEAEMRRGPGPKGLLVAACKDLLPESVQDREKMGFCLPLERWMLSSLPPSIQEGLEQVRRHTPIRQSAVDRVEAGFRAHRLHSTRL